MHDEAATTAVARGVAHVSAVVTGDLADEVQAESDAAVLAFVMARRTVEGLEDRLALVCGDAGSAIGHDEAI
jgi:hypothetical protein